jgi:fatty acid amide hydrolase 2
MDELLSESACEIAASIQRRKRSARQTVDAFIARLEAVNPQLNAVVWTRFDEARREAERVDALSDDELRALPLAGVPCTIKEFFAVRGAPWTGGLVARRAHLAEEDAPTVARLRKAGAIVLGTTNVPEGGIWYETYNGIYGRTNNPWDLSRTPGGSSGGEGAIVAAAGSAFGLGSDIGGSVRLPAAFCGIASHKPTSCTIPNSGQFPAPTGEVLRLLSPGPMARRATDLMPLLRILAGPDGVDPTCEARTWDDPASVAPRELTVHIARDNGRSKAEPVMHAAVDAAAKQLERLGARVVDFDTRRIAKGMEIWAATMGELSEESYEAILASGSDKARISVSVELLKAAVGRSNHTLAALAVGAAGNVMERLTARSSKRAFELGQRLKLELGDLLGPRGVLLMPTFPVVAPKHHAPWRRPISAAYTALFNVLEKPATVVPVGFDRRGLPVTLQIVGARGQDHVTLRVAELLEEAFGGWVLPEVPRA